MDYSQIRGLRISRLALGTAQIGVVDYGLANRIGRPGVQAAHGILQQAIDSGINTFDTGRTYGTSEEVIGSFLESRRDALRSDPPVVVTKFPKVELDGDPSFEQMYELARASVLESARCLRLEQIPVYLIHSAPDMTKFGRLVPEAMVRLREEGLATMVGVSAYRPDEVEAFLDFGEFDAIQIPLNIFDHRLIREGWLDRLAEKEIIVFVRSVFLKGLFFLEPDDLPWYIEADPEPLRQLRELASDSGRSVAELAVAFVRDLPAITTLTIGAETEEQVKENARLIAAPPLSDEVRQTACDLFGELPEEYVNPWIWDRRRQGMPHEPKDYK